LCSNTSDFLFFLEPVHTEKESPRPGRFVVLGRREAFVVSSLLSACAPPMGCSAQGNRDYPDSSLADVSDVWFTGRSDFNFFYFFTVLVEYNNLLY
jgi:hypothetical protein